MGKTDNVTVQLRKLMRNTLLQRRQFVVDVNHAGLPPPSKADLRERIASMLKATTPNRIVLFGFRTKFGGGNSVGFGLAYDTDKAKKEFEPRHRLIRDGEAEPRSRKRKQWKDLKKKLRTTWGTGVRAAKHKQKRANAD